MLNAVEGRPKVGLLFISWSRLRVLLKDEGILVSVLKRDPRLINCREGIVRHYVAGYRLFFSASHIADGNARIDTIPAIIVVAVWVQAQTRFTSDFCYR